MAGFNLGDVFVTFKSKTDDLKRGIDTVKQTTAQAESSINKMSFKQFSSRASESFGSVADAIQGVVAKAAMLGAAAGAGLGVFIKSAGELQQTSKSFEILIGNAEMARKVFIDIKKFADQTPFEFPELAKAAKTLLGYNVSADKVLDRLKRLGDASAAAGGDIGRVTLAYAQMVGRGKITGDNMRQLTENLVTLRKELSQVTGIAEKDLDEAMEQSKLSIQDLDEALDLATNKGGKYFEGTGVLAKSFNGRLSTLKDTVLEFGRNLIGVEVSDELGLVVKPGGVFDRLSQLLPKITQSLQDLGPKASGAFEFLVRNKDNIVAGLAAIAAGFIAAKIAAVGFAIAAAFNPFTLIAAAIIALIAGITYMYVRFEWFRNGVSEVFAFIGRNWEAMLILMTGGAGAILVLIIKNFTSIKNFLGDVFGYLGSLWDKFKNSAISIPGAIAAAMKSVGDLISSPFKAAFNAVVAMWNATLGKLTFRVPDWVPGIGGKSMSLPKLPALAMGTPNFRGGLVRMNEFGPETAVLPKGTKVMTAEQTRQSQGEGNTYHIHLDGVFARSESELADMMERGIKALDRRLSSTGKAQILA